MPTNDWRVEIRGLVETQRKADQTLADLKGNGLLSAFREATMLVVATARRHAKVNTGRHRAHLLPEVRMEGQRIIGIAGTNLDYGPYAVLGRKPGRMPPIDAIERWVWLKRKGFHPAVADKQVHTVALLIARKIAKRGTKGDNSLIIGLEENAPRIMALIGNAVGRIVEK